MRALRPRSSTSTAKPAPCRRLNSAADGSASWGLVRTDSRGVFYFDVPKIPTILYDLYFVKDGFWTVWVRIKPEGPSVYNLALTRQ